MSFQVIDVVPEMEVNFYYKTNNGYMLNNSYCPVEEGDIDGRLQNLGYWICLKVRQYMFWWDSLTWLREFETDISFNLRTITF